jgi:hypothetical protein
MSPLSQALNRPRKRGKSISMPNSVLPAASFLRFDQAPTLTQVSQIAPRKANWEGRTYGAFPHFALSRHGRVDRRDSADRTALTSVFRVRICAYSSSSRRPIPCRPLPPLQSVCGTMLGICVSTPSDFAPERLISRTMGALGDNRAATILARRIGKAPSVHSPEDMAERSCQQLEIA